MKPLSAIAPPNKDKVKCKSGGAGKHKRMTVVDKRRRTLDASTAMLKCVLSAPASAPTHSIPVMVHDLHNAAHDLMCCIVLRDASDAVIKYVKRMGMSTIIELGDGLQLMRPETPWKRCRVGDWFLYDGARDLVNESMEFGIAIGDSSYPVHGCDKQLLWFEEDGWERKLAANGMVDVLECTSRTAIPLDQLEQLRVEAHGSAILDLDEFHIRALCTGGMGYMPVYCPVNVEKGDNDRVDDFVVTWKLTPNAAAVRDEGTGDLRFLLSSLTTNEASEPESETGQKNETPPSPVAESIVGSL